MSDPLVRALVLALYDAPSTPTPLDWCARIIRARGVAATEGELRASVVIAATFGLVEYRAAPAGLTYLGLTYLGKEAAAAFRKREPDPGR